MYIKQLKPEIHIPNFLKAVANCSGNVYLNTDNGDFLNLKSALSQYLFAFSATIETEKFLKNANIYCQFFDDLVLLSDYLADSFLY